MSTLKNHVLRVSLLLTAFAIGSTSFVVFMEYNTHDTIIENDRQSLLKTIHAIVPVDQYNNKILTDTLILDSSKQLSNDSGNIIYRARMNGAPVAVVFTAIAPNGYNGKIKILVGVAFDGCLTGVRVIQHKETPGLGDKIDAKKSDWILNFRGLSLSNPNLGKWRVRKDGGEIDQFTGATITPRAVIAVVKKSLLYFDAHRDELFTLAGIQ